MTEPVHGVVLVGDPDAANELLAAGIHDFMIFDREVVSSVFDDDTDTWTLATEDGETCRGRVVVACESPFVPLVPDLAGPQRLSRYRHACGDARRIFRSGR